MSTLVGTVLYKLLKTTYGYSTHATRNWQAPTTVRQSPNARGLDRVRALATGYA